jgi:hypothetical protein
MAPAAPRSPEEEASEARDVIAFGQETGRVLSDGRIVGRLEPFAKVFPSSGGVKRAVRSGVWAVLVSGHGYGATLRGLLPLNRPGLCRERVHWAVPSVRVGGLAA